MMNRCIVDSIALTRLLSAAQAKTARAERCLQGTWPLSQFSRLTEELADARGEVSWQLEFSSHADEAGTVVRQLDMQIRAHLNLRCQRCLGALAHPINVQRRFYLLETEAEADAAFADDPEAEIETLAADAKFDVSAFIEDELLLELPVTRMHSGCHHVADDDGLEPTDEAASVFSSLLSSLKKKS